MPGIKLGQEITTACKGCTKRYVGCHSICPDYPAHSEKKAKTPTTDNIMYDYQMKKLQKSLNIR